jgi:hypothetical protein
MHKEYNQYSSGQCLAKNGHLLTTQILIKRKPNSETRLDELKKHKNEMK